MSSPEQPTAEIDPRQVVGAYLERESAEWVIARDRARRAGGMSAEANAAEEECMRRVDALLDELHVLGGLAINNTPGLQ